MKEWQKESAVYWGRHMRKYPADGAVPYRYDPARVGNHYWPYPRMECVSRAIVAEGAVLSRPTWENSPQVRAWMDAPKPGLWRRFREWLDK